MKVEYDGKTDILTVTLREGIVAESDEDKPGVILDYDEAGNLLSIEVLDASRRVEAPRSVTFFTTTRRAASWLRRDPPHRTPR
jgi:YD repeat-containing protein